MAAGWEAAGFRPGPGLRRVVGELIETESPDRWRPSIEYTDFGEPLRKTIAAACAEVQDAKISDVRCPLPVGRPRGRWRRHCVQSGPRMQRIWRIGRIQRNPN